jgi:chemotaxis signal transduction protein
MSFKSLTLADITKFSGRKDLKGYLIFSLNGNYFGVPEEQIINVVELKRYSAVPGASDIVIGVINVRSRITTLINLKKILHLNTVEDVTPKGEVILVRFIDDIIGLLVDKVIGFQYIPNDKIKNHVKMFSDKIENKYLIGATIVDNIIILLFNLDLVLDEYEIQEIIQSRRGIQNISLEKSDSISNTKIDYELNLSDDDFQKHADIK